MERRFLGKVCFVLFIIISAICFMQFSVPVYAVEVEPVTLEPQNGIPLIIVRIDESSEAIAAAAEADTEHPYGTVEEMHESPDHSVRCIGTVEFIVPAEYEGDYGSVSVPEGEVALEYIRGRGNMTWDLGIKKPYKIKLDKSADLFGMGKSKEWALMANSMDPTLLRNRITFWLGNEMGLQYSPQSIPVEVVMIGSESGSEYLGSYCLSELIDVEEFRLNIPKLSKKATSETDDITGGYLISIHNAVQDSDVPETGWFTTEKSGISFNFETPDFEGEIPTPGQIEQKEYIKQYVNQLDELIMTDENTIDEERHNQIAELLDLDSAADYWWIQEFSTNRDAFDTNSTFLYKERNGKMYFGPLWDFDLGWRGRSVEDINEALSFNNTCMLWIDQLREKDPLFVEILKNRWSVMDEKLREITEESGILDQYKEEIWESKKADTEIWDSTGTGWNEDTAANAEEAVEWLRKYIDIRREWVNANIDTVGNVHFTVSYEVDGKITETKTFRGQENLDRGHKLSDKDDMIFMGWVEKGSGISHEGYTVKADTTFVPVYKALDEIVQPNALYFDSYEMYSDIAEGSYEWISVRVYPEEAEEDALASGEWSSSDESVAIVDSSGCVEFKKTGDVTITLKLFNGIERSYLLHIYDPEKTHLSSPDAMTVTPAEITLKPGEVTQIEVSFESDEMPCKILPSYAISSDPSIADVDYCGIVTAYEPGTVTLEVVANFIDEDREPLTVECTVTVVEPEETSEDPSAAPAPNTALIGIIGALGALAVALIIFLNKRRK